MKYAARVLTAMVAAAAFPVFFLAPLLKLRYSVILAGESELALSLKEIFFSTVSHGNRVGFWNTMPTRRRSRLTSQFL